MLAHPDLMFMEDRLHIPEAEAAGRQQEAVATSATEEKVELILAGRERIPPITPPVEVPVSFHVIEGGATANGLIMQVASAPRKVSVKETAIAGVAIGAETKMIEGAEIIIAGAAIGTELPLAA